MLKLDITKQKEGEKYDRRKKVGTSRASDIWSLGCLFFELLTGEFLFDNPEFIHFYVQLTGENQQLLKDQKLKLINNDRYLVDFLKYILIRDPTHRPNINNVIKQFDHF
jgi:serine/threonine protein kinase